MKCPNCGANGNQEYGDNGIYYLCSECATEFTENTHRLTLLEELR